MLLAQRAEQFLADLRHAVLVDQREDARLHRRHARIELHEHATWAAWIRRVRLAQQGERSAVSTCRWLDDVREVALVARLVKVLRLVVLAAGGGMRAQVEIGSMRNAFQLAVAGSGEREPILDVTGTGAFLGIVGKFIAVVLAQLQVGAGEADRLPPAEAPVTPPRVPRGGLAWMNEELNLHLFKFPAAEREIARRHFVAERLTNLRNAERNLHACGVHDILEIDKDALRSFWAEIGIISWILNRTNKRLEHQVELPRLGERSNFGGIGANDACAFVGGHGWVRTHNVSGCVKRFALLVLADSLDCLGATSVIAFNERPEPRSGFNGAKNHQVIRAIALLGLAAINHRVTESAHVAGCFPHLGVHDDGAVEAHNVDGLAVRSDQFALHNVLPPCVLEVALQFRAERSVIPEAIDAAVDFT